MQISASVSPEIRKQVGDTLFITLNETMIKDEPEQKQKIP